MKKQILSESSQKSQIDEAFKILMVLLIQENLRTHIAYLLVSMKPTTYKNKHQRANKRMSHFLEVIRTAGSGKLHGEKLGFENKLHLMDIIKKFKLQLRISEEAVGGTFLELPNEQVELYSRCQDGKCLKGNSGCWWAKKESAENPWMMLKLSKMLGFSSGRCLSISMFMSIIPVKG
ncbi:hypothetical protein NC653_011131 [Populus alba x Populus x berolinensis]|uniref:Uncharacterized protein n=1 Tax=Populus alba x Populus x berolinensis TaxID=444605 RepID=A0AAD6R194_9ROSI|nr:hypothetical protein NC653_011131 [Populus alba x Populus x berolinensis]